MNYIKAHINLRTFDEGLNNKKHVQILDSLKGPYQQVFMYDKRL
jgi:hypothetical protein